VTPCPKTDLSSFFKCVLSFCLGVMLRSDPPFSDSNRVSFLLLLLPAALLGF
jgi:hypothetical protein